MGGLTGPRPLQEDDDRLSFNCGRPSLDTWFHRHSWRNQMLGSSRTNVICESRTGSIAGFVSLSASQIERSALPKSGQRNQPDPIPAILLGQLAVDRQWQGKGLSTSLLHFAFRTTLSAADSVGCHCLITHPLDDGVRAFYRRFGFEDLPFDPRRAMAVRLMDLRRSGF